MEAFVSNFGFSPWGPAALTFICGVGLGWFVWGSRPARNGGERVGDLAGEPKELVVLKSEIKSAKDLLERPDEPYADISDELVAVDERVQQVSRQLSIALDILKKSSMRS
jgi:hypothetical protein